MEAIAIKKQLYEEDHIAFNEISIDQLFKKYEEVGFLYPAKKTLLRAHFTTVTQNWKKLIHGANDLLWFMNTKEACERCFASVSICKETSSGILAQHLVANGNPSIFLKVMLAAQNRAKQIYGEEEFRACQNWFQPDDRYLFRVFATMYDHLGPDKSALSLFHYLHLPLTQIKENYGWDYQAEAVRGFDPECISFVRRQYGGVFVKAEELDQEDIELKKLAATFATQGLKRSRNVYKIRDTHTHKIVACIIANRAPLGMNFSYLENKAYYIFDKNLESIERRLVLHTANAIIKPLYLDIALQAIPIVTDASTSSELIGLRAFFVRVYMQSIWIQKGFKLWDDHIHAFLARMEQGKQTS